MKILAYLALTCSILGFSFDGHTQDLTMATGTFSRCNGVLFDPGGSNDYPLNSNVTMTICPATPGAQVRLTFTMFVTERNIDELRVYNGNSTAAGDLLGTYTGGLLPFSVQSSAADGCLTLVFESDSSIEEAGFEATMSCELPCQTIIASVLSSSKPIVGEVIDICLNESLTLTGTGDYPATPKLYPQSNANCTFQWDLGNLSFTNGQTTTFSYAVSGVYDVDLKIEDINGCDNSNDINLKVRVSDVPSFTGTTVTETDICIGESNTLFGAAQDKPIEFFCATFLPDTTDVPDGVGVAYESDITLDCFDAGRTVTAATDISAICLDIEHSYLHDLEIKITCPNATEVTLYQSYLGSINSVQLGEPVDDDLSLTYGDPYAYCFTNTAPYTWYDIAESLPAPGGPGTPIHSYTDNDGVAVNNVYYIEAGDYLPDEDFAGLNGCPLNGDWTITITDNLPSDNGTMFSWSIDFDPALITTTYDYTPPIVDTVWIPEPTITVDNGTQIEVLPVATGTKCYTFRATDEFGCNYDTLVCFNVGALEDATFNYAQTAYCQNEVNPGPVLTVTADGTFTSTAGLIIDVNSGEINLKSSTIGTYDVTYSTPGVGCVNTSTIQVEITGFPTAIMSGDATICEGETADIQIALTGTGPWAVVYNDGTSDNTVSGITSSPYVITTGTSGSYSLVSVSNAQCSGTTSGTADIVVNQQVSFSNVTATCGGGDYTVTFNLSGGDPGSYSVSGMDDGTITNPSAGVYLYTSDPIDAGTTNYTFDFEDDFQCNLATITGVKNCSCGATAMLSGGGETCAGDSVELIVDFTGDAPFDFTYTDGTTPVTVNGVPGLTYSFYIQVQGDYSLTAMSDDLCLGSASGSANVKINNAPTVSVNDFSICEGEPQTISATASILGGNYTWTPGVFAHSSSISVSPASTQYYYVDYKLNGCSGVDSSLVTVNPIPTVTVIDYTICANETQIITTTVDLAGGDYSWTPGSFGNVDEISVTPSVTTDYEVDYILDGCTSSDISTVTVVPGLTLNMTDVEICDGESAPVSGIGSPAGGSYQWNEPLAPIGSNTNSITVSPAVDTYYPLLYSFSGCTVLDSAFVKVNFVPTVTVADQTICEGSSATLVSVTDSSGGGYNWTPGPFNSPQITVSPSSTTTYDLVYRIGTCSASTSAQVIVDATLTVLVASETICEGDSVELFAVASPAGGVYDWLHNSATTQSVWVQPTVSSSFNVVYSFDGCVASTSGLVTVNPTPTIDADSDSPLCLGDDLNLTVTTDATDFDWSGPNGFGSIDQNPIVLSVTDLDSGQYYVTVTLNGCSKTDSTYVEVNTAFADFSVFEDEGCTPFNAVFTNESANSVTCTWDFGNGQTSSVCDATHVYTGSGTFNVSLTIIDDNGCAANESKPEFIYIESNPNANFSFAPDYLDVDDQTAQMINETSGAVSYNWVFPDGTSTIEESPEHLFSLEEGEEGVIWLYAYSPLGCVDSVSKIIETTQPLIFFIPNSFTPDGDIFNNTWRPVMTAGFEPDRYQVSVYNRWGELVFRTEDSNEGWDGSAKNSNEKSADGIYTYVVVFTVSENDERKQYSGTISLNR